MARKVSLFALATVFSTWFVAVSTAAPAGIDSLLAPGAKLEKISGDFTFTEGPAADQDGNVYFTDQPNDRIMRYGVDGRLTVFRSPSGRSNGLYFDLDGRLLACADEQNQIWSIGPVGDPVVLVRQYRGHLLNGPNDLWVHPSGAVYFTDPFYKRPYWKRGPSEQDVQGVYRLSPDRKAVKRVVDELVQPNGIIGTPDGTRLYVADIGAGKTYQYRITPSGDLTERQLFCEMGSDGMTIDSDGNVYLTGKGVTVFNPEGKEIGNLTIPEPWTANVTFGGAHRQTLFITASKGLYAILLRTHGAL